VNARSMTRTATMVATTLMMAMTVSSVDAGPRGRMNERLAQVANGNKEVACRSLATYPMSAWVAPMAVVLTSPEAWSRWNREQVDAGRAVAEEAMPQGVDWTREVVVVLAMGEVSEPHMVEVKGARRNQNATQLDLHVEMGRGGRCPALVLALDRGAGRNVKLAADYLLAGVPTEPGTYDATGAAGNVATSGDDGGLVVMTSWGAVKAEYR
jgi:hypothetical protein